MSSERAASLCEVTAPESISDLLAGQPTDSLEAMLRSLQDRVNQLEVEANLVAAELQRRHVRDQRRNGRRVTGLKREHVLETLYRVGPATPPLVTAVVNEDGYGASVNAVRNHLVRLVDDGLAFKYGDGTYEAAGNATGNGQGHRVGSGDHVQGQLAG